MLSTERETRSYTENVNFHESRGHLLNVLYDYKIAFLIHRYGIMSLRSVKRKWHKSTLGWGDIYWDIIFPVIVSDGLSFPASASREAARGRPAELGQGRVYQLLLRLIYLKFIKGMNFELPWHQNTMKT